MQIIKRNGQPVDFDGSKIEQALTKAFNAHYTDPAQIASLVTAATSAVTQLVETAFNDNNQPVHIETVQNYVEQALMQMGEPDVARGYILYRNARAKDRAAATHCVRLKDGTVLCKQDLVDSVVRACVGLEGTDPALLVDRAFRELFDGATAKQVSTSLILASRTMIEREPEYSFVTARFLLDELYCEVFNAGRVRGLREDPTAEYQRTFENNLMMGVGAGIYNPKLTSLFNLPLLAGYLDASRDLQFDYLGLQTLYDRYFVHLDGSRIEAPQSMFMRIAMGLSLNEADPTTAALQFYDLLSSFDYMASTPTLFNAGLVHSQLSSCYLTTVPDDLAGIFGTYRDNGLLSKFAGGIGNDWTMVRALGAHIKGTNGKSQGIVPFLKINNDTAVAVNQGGKRKGAICSYLETWHLDIEEFIELRKNTGDERRRTHDMNTANWIPDLFMQRVEEDGKWTLFSPDEAGHLHDLYGEQFQAAYEDLELRASLGELNRYKVVEAKALWRKMLTMLFETGHPWLTFKDPCNIRSPQQHCGVVHSSNLCTEITLNTKVTKYDQNGERVEVGEVAVCNLGSVNLPQHLDANNRLDMVKLRRTVTLAVRLLDNVIDLNYYPVPEAANSNLKHRPVGLGLMGFQDTLYMQGISYNSVEATHWAGVTMEAIAYYAILASAQLAEERGSYETFDGSLWSKGVLPQDTPAELALARGKHGEDVLLRYETGNGLDWNVVREAVVRGMRNSNVMAIAPTATIANIVGVVPSIEPAYKNLYVKDNLSGTFTVINSYLVNDLRARGLWDDQMIADLKQSDGSLQPIARVPADLKELYRTAFEVEPTFLIDAAVVRQLWIDQGQSLNLYMAGATGKKLDTTYRYGWRRGLKTNYYLRTAAASGAEKSTGATTGMNTVKAAPNLPEPEVVGAVCTMRPGDPGFSECEACS